MPVLNAGRSKPDRIDRLGNRLPPYKTAWQIWSEEQEEKEMSLADVAGRSVRDVLKEEKQNRDYQDLKKDNIAFAKLTGIPLPKAVQDQYDAEDKGIESVSDWEANEKLKADKKASFSGDHDPVNRDQRLFDGEIIDDPTPDPKWNLTAKQKHFDDDLALEELDANIGKLAPIEPTVGYPDNNPKTVLGMSKPSTFAIPPVAILHLGGAMNDGKEKYGLFNWREKSVSTSVYMDAIDRHRLAFIDGEDVASDSGRKHLAHIMACCAILLDAEAQGNLNDDRGHKGTAGAFIEQNTKVR